MKMNAQSRTVPDGRYVVRYLGDRSYGDCVAADFEISTGPHRGLRVMMLICSRRASKAIRERSRDWLEWIAYDGDAKASKVLDSILNSVAGYFFADVEDGYVKKTASPTTSEATFNRFMKQLCELWTLSQGGETSELNLAACQRYREILDSLPRIWGVNPGERELRQWLDAASDPSSESYFAPASIWLNMVYKELGGVYERPAAGSWPLILKNNGFNRPPKRPRSTSSEI